MLQHRHKICILPLHHLEVRHSRCVNQITNMADVQSKHNYIYYSYRWYTYLSTATCFGLYISHPQVVDDEI